MRRGNNGESSGTAVRLTATTRQPQAQSDGNEQADAQAEGDKAPGKMQPDRDQPETRKYDNGYPE